MSSENDNSADDIGREEKDFLSTVADRKREALGKGKNTDCSFLVGPDDHLAEVFHASKFDLISASEYFEAMLRSPLTRKGCHDHIRIKQVEPRIFKMVLEYIHMHSLSLELLNLDNSVLLARAADEYLIRDLSALCCKYIKDFLSVDRVWKILEENVSIPLIAISCKEFVIENTKQCLQHESFLEISIDLLLEFLKLKNMNISSEKDLICACLRYSEAKNDIDIMQLCLPHLRLLTLHNAEDLELLSEVLPLKETNFILQRMLLLKDSKKSKLAVPSTLCPITEERCTKHPKYETLVLIPEKELRSSRELIENKKLCKEVSVYNNKFPTSIVCFETSEHILVKQIEVLCKIEIEPMLVNSQPARLEFGSMKEYKSNINLEVWVSNSLTTGKSSQLITRDVFRTGSSICFNFDEPLLVAKGNQMQVRAALQSDCFYRNIFAKTVQDGLNQWNDISVLKKVFKNLQVHCIEGGTSYESRVFFIKNLTYTVIEV